MPPSWLIHSGRTLGGIVSLGMTTIRNCSTKEPGDGGAASSGEDLVDGGSNVGATQQCFVGGSFVLTTDSVEVEGEMVRPTMGTDVGEGAIWVVVYMRGGCTVGVVRIVEGCSLAASEPVSPITPLPTAVPCPCVRDQQYNEHNWPV